MRKLKLKKVKFPSRVTHLTSDKARIRSQVSYPMSPGYKYNSIAPLIINTGMGCNEWKLKSSSSFYYNHN